MTAYYNEIDPYAAQWLRNLIAAGHIAPGDVDERSIEDVRPIELVGYEQCHFFAGIGVWSYALRQAGIPDSYPVWTGSCPCQPFSAAGQRAGFADERHLWPAWFHLIDQCRPATLLGEQVASADADPWIDLVCADLERLGYAFGATPFPAASVGAPHIRDRLYWVGHATGGGCGIGGSALESGHIRHADGAGNASGGMADADGWNSCSEGLQRSGQHGLQPQDGGIGSVADPSRIGQQRRQGAEKGRQHERPDAGRVKGNNGLVGVCEAGNGSRRTGPVNGFWRDADWLCCRDGRWRPVEPGTFPLASGIAGRVGQLRAYGNAINAEAARIFIECVMESA